MTNKRSRASGEHLPEKRTKARVALRELSVLDASNIPRPDVIPAATIEEAPTPIKIEIKEEESLVGAALAWQDLEYQAWREYQAPPVIADPAVFTLSSRSSRDGVRHTADRATQSSRDEQSTYEQCTEDSQHRVEVLSGRSDGSQCSEGASPTLSDSDFDETSLTCPLPCDEEDIPFKSFSSDTDSVGSDLSTGSEANASNAALDEFKGIETAREGQSNVQKSERLGIYGNVSMFELLIMRHDDKIVNLADERRMSRLLSDQDTARQDKDVDDTTDTESTLSSSPSSFSSSCFNYSGFNGADMDFEPSSPHPSPSSPFSDHIATDGMMSDEDEDSVSTTHDRNSRSIISWNVDKELNVISQSKAFKYNIYEVVHDTELNLRWDTLPQVNNCHSLFAEEVISVNDCVKVKVDTHWDDAVVREIRIAASLQHLVLVQWTWRRDEAEMRKSQRWPQGDKGLVLGTWFNVVADRWIRPSPALEGEVLDGWVLEVKPGTKKNSRRLIKPGKAKNGSVRASG